MVEPFFFPPGQPADAMYGGLDLPVAQAICALHGGRLWAELPATGVGIVLLLTLAHVPRTRAAQPLPAPVTPEATDARHNLFPARSRPVVLVIERDPRLLRYMRANLDAQHFRTFAASGIEEAQRLIAREEPDLLLLGSSLDGDAEPVEHGLRRVREWTDALTLILVDQHDPAECSRALDLGAADYLGKPLAIEELVARMRRALRDRETARHPAGTTPATFVSGELEVDFEQRTVTVAGKPAALSKTEFKLLRTLAQNAGRVLTHEMLLERVWGPGYAHEVEFVWVYVRRLRRKIEPDPAHPRFIQTIPGVGYRLARD
jgi:DNA-binding response OmpR family regulator